MTTPTPKDRLIVALDFPTATAALAHVDQLDNQILWFKVGLELYLAAGNSIIEKLTARGHTVFLDLKLHDIPNTVASAVRTASQTGASLLTLHAAGGPAMLRAAAEAAATIPSAPRLLAVTVLTSMDALQLAAIGVPTPPAAQVDRLALMASAEGITGLVCSSHEVAHLRLTLPRETLLVVPGIRSATATTDDQSRTADAPTAIAAGASMLVIGRPITRAPNPAQAAQEILQQIATADR